MHPAGSVILFSTLTGLGYGLCVWLGVSVLLGAQVEACFGLIALGFAWVVITTGLLSSTMHLGRPGRAWRAMSQWRTSWLSREGISAILTYVPLMSMAAGFYWEQASLLAISAVALIIGSLSTVFTTSMIYASLKPIPAWSNPWTVPSYFICALFTGLALYNALAQLSNGPAIMPELIGFLALLAIAIKALYWRYIRVNQGETTAETALGLKGSVRTLDPPHSSANYLMKEMGFQLVRSKAQPLRALVIISWVLVLLGISFTDGTAVWIHIAMVLLAMVGVISERYLFFAQARHVVMTYYRP